MGNKEKLKQNFELNSEFSHSNETHDSFLNVLQNLWGRLFAVSVQKTGTIVNGQVLVFFI